MLCLLFLCGIGATAQESVLKSEYSYRRYTTHDGLPSNTNNNIIQDGKGFIWIAGPSGFIRYDGFTFTNFMEGRDANLYRLDKDENGNVRAFSQNLMYSFDQNNTLIKTALSADRNRTDNTSFAHPDGYGIYFTPSSEGRHQALYKVNGNQLEKVLEHPYLDDFPDDTHTFFDVEKQELYLFYDEDTIRIIASGKEAVTYTGVVARAACKFNNAVFIIALDGIYRFADRKMTRLIKADFHIQVTPAKVIADAQGTLWFSGNNTLYRYDGEKIEAIFRANVIKDFIFDNENNLWVVTFQGLYNLFRMDFMNYRLRDETDVVRTVVWHPAKDAVIAGTLNGKLIEIGRNGAREVRYPANPYDAAFFYDYSAVKEDALCLAGPGDVLMLNDREKRWLNLPFFNTPVFVIPLSNGNWLEGGFGRLIEFSAKGKTVRDFGDFSMQQHVFAKPCFDAGGRLWLGGGKGITIYDYTAQSIVKTIFSDFLKPVRFMNNDAEGNVWFASENRLYISSGDTVRLERTLPRKIDGIYFTRQSNRLIVVAIGGFYLFDKERKHAVFYNHENGFTGSESSSGAMAEDADGNIWMPTLEGLFRFHPEKLMNTAKPKMQPVSFLSSTNNIQWKPVEEAAAKLNYLHKNIRFDFIGLSYTSAQNVRYHYRLLGFQNDWSEPTKQREVTFNNLPPGNYVFEIYADAGTDESRSETQSVSFTITPALWQTAWFRVLCVALLILASAGVALVVQRRKNKALMEKLRAEKELNELRISSIRLKAIPHFNANVLSSIEYYIANRTKEEAMRILSIYSDFTFKTLSEVDKASRPLSEELAYVKMYLDLEKIRFMDKFDFSIEVDKDVNESVQLPNMILHTYCENAVKHGLMPLKSGGRLTIHVSQHNRAIMVSVEDNGVGRAYAGQNPHLHSAKQGLSILNRQIEIYNRFNREKIIQQVIDLSKDGKPNGTRFTVEAPLDFTYVN